MKPAGSASSATPPETAGRVAHRRWGRSLAKLIDLDDCVQQAWEVYLSRPDRFPPDADPVWVTGKLVAALHTWCLALYRRAKYEVGYGGVSEDYDPDAPRVDPVDPRSAAPVAWVDAMDAATEVCSTVELRLVILKAQGYTTPEAAEILGLTVANAAVLVSRLRKRLRLS